MKTVTRRSRRRIGRLFLVAVAGMSLGSACSPTASPTPVQQSPVQPSLPPATPEPEPLPSLSGTVVAWSPLGQRPLGGASINAWVKTGRGSFSYWFLNGPHYADAEGRFEMRNLPAGATVVMDVKKDGYVQQCSTEITVQAGSHQLDVQLVSVADVSDSPAAAPPAPGRHVRGFVYEFTAQGRQPVAKAYVAYMAGPDFDTATTVTDQQGRFLLCGLPESQSVQLGIFGVGRQAYHRLPPGPNATVELELK